MESTFEPDAIADLYKRACRYVEELAARNFNDIVSESVPCLCSSMNVDSKLQALNYNAMDNRDIWIQNSGGTSMEGDSWLHLTVEVS